MAPATRCFANWLLSQFGSADRDGPWSLRVRTTVLTRQFGGPHDKCFPNNLLGRRQRKFPTRHRSPPLAPRFNGRRSAVGTFPSVLPWRPRPTARPRAPPGWMRDRFFPQGGWDEPDFLPCRHGSTFVVASGRYRRRPFAARTARSPGGAASTSICHQPDCLRSGLVCAPDGCPVAIEVLDGKTADPMRLPDRSASSNSASISIFPIICAPLREFTTYSKSVQRFPCSRSAKCNVCGRLADCSTPIGERLAPLRIRTDYIGTYPVQPFGPQSALPHI